MARRYDSVPAPVKGCWLEDPVEKALKIMKGRGKIESYKRFQRVKNKPDFIVNRVDEIECKNKDSDPSKKNAFSPYGIKNDLLRRFTELVGRKILLIPKLKFQNGEEEKCRRLLKSKNVIVVEGFPWVTPENKDEMVGFFIDLLTRLFVQSNS